MVGRSTHNIEENSVDSESFTYLNSISVMSLSTLSLGRRRQVMCKTNYVFETKSLHYDVHQNVYTFHRIYGSISDVVTNIIVFRLS